MRRPARGSSPRPLGYGWTQRARRVIALPALATALSLASVVLVSVAPPSAQANVCVLVPQLRDAMVSQGIGSTPTSRGYTTLVRGKTTLVKAYLSKPQCATTQDRVQITSSTLAFTFDGIAGSIGNTITGPVFPELLNYSAAPAVNGASDPVFSVPGALLDGPRKDVRVSAAFTITADYTATSSTGITTTGRVVLAPPSSPTSPTATATFEKTSNSLRVLVAVLGDPSKGFAHNWPARTAEGEADGADDVLLRALQAAGRIAPLKDGVVRDLTGQGGIRYVVAPTVVDVKSALRPDGKFCGNGGNFTYVRSQLSGFLNNWQAANGGSVVDAVLGVVWGPNSIGPATDGSCADGYAAVGGTQAWTRLQADTESAPGNSGNLISMETIGHNFGSVPTERDATGDAYHSAVTADAGSLGFNTATRVAIANAASVLKYGVTNWNDYNTLLRREDWTYTLCRLTPASSEFCPVANINLNQNTTPVGAGAVLVPQVYALAGTTDGTAAGTGLDTFLSENTDVTEPSTTSEFSLVQRGADGTNEPILSTTRFDVSFQTSEHHAGHEHEHPASQMGTVDVRFAAVSGARVFEVYKGDPKTTAPLYRRERDGAPVAGPFSVVRGTGQLVDQGAGTQPALSPDGRTLAYASGANVIVKDLASSSTFQVPGTSPSWLGSSLVVVGVGHEAGDLVLVEAKPSGARRTIYDASQHVELLQAPAGRATAWMSGSTSNFVTSIAGDLWHIRTNPSLLSPTGETCRLNNPDIAPCYRLTTEPAAESDPVHQTFTTVVDGRERTVERVLFTKPHTEPVSTGAPETKPGIFSITLDRVQSAGPLVRPGAQAAVLPDGKAAAYSTTAGLGLADGKSLSVTNGTLTTDPTDAWPSLHGEVLAFARGSSASRVYTTRLRTNRITFSASDAQPDRLQANVYAACDGLNHPIFVHTPPSRVTGSEATWMLDWDGAGSTCSTPLLYAMVNDGIEVTRLDLGPGIGSVRPPVGTIGAIYAPAPGSTVLQYETVSLLGDVPGVTDTDLTWIVTGPDGSSTSLPFQRGPATSASPPSGGWRTGTHTVALRRVGSVLASGAFTVVADEDHDNIPGLVEQACLGENADRDPTNASGDQDRDGEANVSDPTPCSSSVNVSVDLDANTLNTSANGNTVTLYVTRSPVDLTGIPMSGIAATRIGNYDANLPAIAYEKVTATSAVVKLSRKQLQAFVAERGLTGYVRIILSGTGPAGSFRGFDPTDPTFS